MLRLACCPGLPLCVVRAMTGTPETPPLYPQCPPLRRDLPHPPGGGDAGRDGALHRQLAGGARPRQRGACHQRWVHTGSSRWSMHAVRCAALHCSRGTCTHARPLAPPSAAHPLLPIPPLPSPTPAVSGYGRQSWMREGGELPRVNASNIEQALNKSLQRLGTDHVDLLQIHWPDRYVPLFGE